MTKLSTLRTADGIRAEDLAGDHEPTLSTVERFARGMGIEIHVDITPAASELRETA